LMMNEKLRTKENRIRCQRRSMSESPAGDKNNLLTTKPGASNRAVKSMP
jgi:hypothetical protein